VNTIAKFLVLAAPACLLPITALAAPAKDYPIQPVPFTAVSVQDGFWRPRMETNRKVTVRYEFQKCEETGRIDNFAKAGGLMKGGFRGIPFDDSDVYKVIEGAAYSLALAPNPQLDKYLDDLIAKIAAAQEPDGYLYTARRLLPPDKMPGMSGKARWVNEGASHELYNVGHPQALRRQARRHHDPRLVAGLFHRRGGIFHRHPARRTSGGDEAGLQGAGIRHRH